MDSLFAPLDKNRVTTGILYERVRPWANIDLFNVSQSNPPSSDYGFFLQSYFELFNASINNSAWLKPSGMRMSADRESYIGHYAIGVLDYQFNMIDSNAVSNGLLTYSNGQFHDVSGSSSPFYTRRFQVGAVLAAEIPNGLVSFYYNPDFIKTNLSVQISSINLNFGSIGNYTLTPANSSVNVNFTGSGLKQFTITVTYSNGSSFSNSSEIKVGENEGNYTGRILNINAPAPNDSFWVSSKYPYQGFGESQPYYGKAKVSIWWKLDANEIPVPGIQKPVIIVDGIDALDERKNLEIYDLFKFVNETGNPRDFADELRMAGFDIIVMDMPKYTGTEPSTMNDLNSSLPYPKPLFDEFLPASLKGTIYGGGDFTQRSAYCLEYLIDHVNSELQQNNSTEKIVIVGPSMGGQTTRYALRDMEKRGQNHNTRLWVSFDSPHEGAYVPVGVQYSINELAHQGSEEARFILDAWINCPAAKQFTIHHYSSFSEPVAGASNFFTPYYSEINDPNFGFPQASGLRKIAMLNGSDLGVPLPVGTACQLATEFKVTFKPRGFLGFILSYIWPLGDLPGMIGYAISPLQKHKTFLAPNTGNCTIFDYSNDFAPNYTRKINAPTWANTSLDLIQGGFFPGFSFYKKELDGKRPKKWYKDLVVTEVDDFMSNDAHELTYSTLAMGLGTLPDLTRKWDANFRIDKFNQPCDVTCPETKESPFDMYWAPDINTRHDSLLFGHVIRLRKEIKDNQEWQKTQLQRQATITSTKTQLCSGESFVLTAINPLPGMIYNWVPSDPSFQITSGQGTPSVTVQHNGSSTPFGYYSINCQASSQCYLINGSYSIHFGGYTSSDYPISGPSTTCPNSSVYFSAPSLPGATSYNWFWPSGWTYYYGQGTTNLALGAGSQSGVVGVRVTNVCDPIGGTPAIKYVQVLNCGGGWRFYVSPNPTNGNIVVSSVPDQKQTTRDNNQIRIYQLRIIDQSGNIKKQYRYPGGIKTVYMNTSNMAAGVYVIQAFNGKTWEAAKFVKQ